MTDTPDDAPPTLRKLLDQFDQLDAKAETLSLRELGREQTRLLTLARQSIAAEISSRIGKTAQLQSEL